MESLADQENPHMTLEDFKLWSTNALKKYLFVRGKSNDGSFDNLAARLVVYSIFFSVVRNESIFSFLVALKLSTAFCENDRL